MKALILTREVSTQNETMGQLAIGDKTLHTVNRLYFILNKSPAL